MQCRLTGINREISQFFRTTSSHARAKYWALLPIFLFWYKNCCRHFQLHHGKGIFQEIWWGLLDTQILKVWSCFCSKYRSTKLCFFWFYRKPDNTPNEFTILIAFLSDLVSSRMSLVSSGNCEILAFCPFGSSIPRQSWSWRTLTLTSKFKFSCVTPIRFQ